jgi:amidase
VNDVLALSGVKQAALIREGHISPSELLEAHRAHIEKINPSLNAVIALTPPAAAAHGPFEGVPFSVKDSIQIHGQPCTAGTWGYRNSPPASRDAALISRLRGVGAVPIARTNLPDLLFAFESDNLIFGRTNNPYDTSRTAGGSSGGEAALIASCGTPFGLGSDAAGSVRLPAHYSGIASIKPTSGRLDRTGHAPPPGGWIEMIWQIGPLARHVEDLIALMPILAGVPIEGPPPKSVAFFTDNGILPADEDTRKTVHDAVAALERAGYRIEEARPACIGQSYDLEMKILGPDGGDGLKAFAASIGSDRLHPLFEGWLTKLQPYRTDLTGFARYWAELDRFRAEMSAFMTRYDAILSPVAAFPAVPHGTSIDEAIFPGYSYTMTHNMTGWPAAVVRCGASGSGLPIGVQIAAPAWREDAVLHIARDLEEALGGWRMPPFLANAD